MTVGAYRIRPEGIRVDKWTHSGVCDTPLHGMFADIQILNSSFNKMLTIYLARHGQTEENLSRIFQGHLPGHLTEEGKRQAIALGKALENIPLDAIVSSDLQRVADTVRLAVGSRDLPWEKNALFREVDWGSWTGRSINSVDRSCFPKDAETPAMLYARAGKCIDYLKQHCEGKSVLVVAHGQINRNIIAQARGIPLGRLKEIPLMKNGTTIQLIINN